MRSMDMSVTRQTILIVDDQPENLVLLEAGLEDIALIITCHNPARVVNLALSYAPDIILLDIEMPDINGFDLCKMLKEHPRTKHCAIIFITSHNDFENETKALALGAVDFIGRPINLNVCRIRIQNHLHIRSQEILLQQAYDLLQKEKEHLHITLNSIGDAVIATDKNENVTFLNPVAQRLTGWNGHSAIGQPVSKILTLLDATTNEPMLNPVSIALRDNRVVALALNAKIISRQGREFQVEDSAAPIKDANGVVTGAVVVFQDVTESIAMATQMSHLTNHDQLTGLPNRLLLHDRLLQAIPRNQKALTKLAVLLIDIDNFKFLNDTLGHQAGDKVIFQLSQRLEQLCDAHTSLSRIGGDEFVLMVSDIITANHIEIIASQASSLAGEPVMLNEEEYKLSVSIGISVFPDDAKNEKELVRHADTAMYRAKSLGRDRFCYFSEELQNVVDNRFAIERQLKRALDDHALEVFYQPKHNLITGALAGAEGLVRLRAEDGTIIPPDNFIPLAEETGLIHPLGEQVLDQCCAAASRWLKQGSPVKVGVNIAALQFSNSGFFDTVTRALKKYDLPAELLELEVTESALMHDFDETRNILQKLSDIGVSISLDDFGTGYSSLSYLRFFPLGVLKVDRSFVKDMLSDGQARSIVDAIIHLARSMHLELVAEGIETKAQLDALRDLGCQEGQGYYYSKPLPVAEFESRYVNMADATYCARLQLVDSHRT
ncbi:EAL domain-containing protein [Salinimonas sediminis]|uniref:EAL domain-containing protein n=2 Tax=Salinimonas sediminis TaxID=2303538 RepID=A0A346NPD3_9ALTE|nr:EAL domain-containing protein [Salinimonas sediminis]